jgi:integrase/recombinase XerD
MPLLVQRRMVMSDSRLLGPFVRRFLLEEVIADRSLSINTQRSYRDSIHLLFSFIKDFQGTDPIRVTISQITVDLLRAFLAYLEKERGNSIATLNQRLGALHSLFRFIGRQVPELVEQASHIQSLQLRRAPIPTMDYLDKHEIDALLAVPNQERRQGLRDYALLLFLYNTGARASEAGTVALDDLSLDPPPSVRLMGKGRKVRLCPLWTYTAMVLKQLLGDRIQGPPNKFVFLNVRGQPITRFGVHTLLERSVQKATETCPSLSSKRVSPHTIRHTTAVHLLRAGVDINTIRAWLGHVSLETTNRYAEVELEMKAKALETCAVEGVSRDPLWRKDQDLMAFLASL